MSNDNIQAACRHFASARGAAPFTSAECFDLIKDADDSTAVSDALGRLFRKGDLARRKIDGVRFQYVWAKFADDTFDQIGDAPPEIKPRAKRTQKAAPSEVKPDALIAATGYREEPAPALEIPNFLRKFPDSDTKPEKGGLVGTSPNAETIADKLIERLRPMLQAQMANAHLESADAIAHTSSRVTVRIKEVEITVEGL